MYLFAITIVEGEHVTGYVIEADSPDEARIGAQAAQGGNGTLTVQELGKATGVPGVCPQVPSGEKTWHEYPIPRETWGVAPVSSR